MFPSRFHHIPQLVLDLYQYLDIIKMAYVSRNLLRDAVIRLGAGGRIGCL